MKACVTFLRSDLFPCSNWQTVNQAVSGQELEELCGRMGRGEESGQELKKRFLRGRRLRVKDQ